MDYAIFDGILDSVLIVDETNAIVYANEVAATLCESSVRRLTKGKKLHEVIEFPNSDGVALISAGPSKEPSPVKEIAFQLTSGKAGKVQMTVQSFLDDQGLKNRILVMRDVTLEEILHGKYRAELEQKEDVIVQLREAQKELEAYSKNLEQMVDERTKEVKRANQMLNAIMNSLGQGFLTFDENGVCSNIYTRACETVLEKIPAGQHITQVLNLTGGDESQFKDWMRAVFADSLPFESLKDLAPQLYRHSQDHHITLDYFAIRSDSGTISNLVVVATDKTNEFEASHALERERQFAKMVMKLVTNRRQFGQFLDTIDRYLERLRLLNYSAEEVAEAYRVLHTLEGEAGVFSAMRLRDAAREAQHELEPFRQEGQTPGAAEFKSVVQRLVSSLSKAKDEFYEQNRVLFAALKLQSERSFEVAETQLHRFFEVLKAKGVPPGVCSEFYDLMASRPISEFFGHYNDVMQTIAEKLGKKVAPLQLVGGDIRLNPEKYDGFFGSLIHSFRNALDHGIESCEEREMVGKPAEGQVTVNCSFVNGKGGDPLLRLVIEDDGQGISPRVIRNKMKKNRPKVDWDQISDHDVIQNIFDPGFSSRSEVGEFSGRGVGMDAIKTEVERLQGKVEVFSEQGVGTRLVIDLPFVPVISANPGLAA